MTDDDLIRRGDVRFLVNSTVDIEYADVDTLRSRIESLPADPVATAALALAKSYLKSQDKAKKALAKMGVSDARSYMLALVGSDPLSEELYDAADAFRAAEEASK